MRGKRPVLGVLAAVVLCGAAVLAAVQTPVHPAQDADASSRVPVPRGTEPVDVIVTAVAMSKEPWLNTTDYSYEILLLRVDKVLGAAKVARYVRADFNEISVYTNSEESRVYRQLLSSLREPRIWKIHLKPPSLPVHCWTIPPPPIPGDLMSSRSPLIVPVGDASGYPGINTVPCYLVDQRDIQEIKSPDNH
jgi:hypothetical protein